MQWDIRRIKETGSTNEDACSLGRAGSPAGLVCIAESQSRGRGRLNRSWYSPPGAGLYCSVLLRPSINIKMSGLLSFCAALAMTDTLRSFDVPALVKWPNDIVLEGRKLCGILSSCDGDSSGLRFAVIGCGLNLLPGSYPDELKDRAACLAEYGFHPDREILLLRYLDALAQNVSILEKSGFSPLRIRMETVCALLSKPVHVSGGQKAEGIVEGIGNQGELILRLANGQLLLITCGDVSVRGENGYV